MQVARWGNSLAVRLPKALVDKLGLKPGDDLRIVAADDERIAVEKADARQAALQRMAKRQWPLPRDYQFDRDEANER